ncbi:MAG: carbohydrate kinase [Thermaerobacter sp.]|nr:carbohydrate kinase [Thermaerobacter sp.]
MILTVGEALVDLLATRPGELATGSTLQLFPGGAPANVAVAAIRLGMRAGILARVGDDPLGRVLERTLGEEGVDVRWLAWDRAHPTALAFVTLGRGGERSFFFPWRETADAFLSPQDVPGRLPADARVLHFAGVSLAREPARSATRQAVELFRAGGRLVSFDPNLRLGLWADPEEARTVLREAAALADLVKLNREELAFLEGEGAEEVLARRLLERGPRLVVVTAGQAGCGYYAPRLAGRVNAFSVAAVDTTGAGDAFAGALLSRLAAYSPRGLSTLEEDGLRSALGFAGAVGAMATLRRGAMSGLPTLRQVYRFLGVQGGLPA